MSVDIRTKVLARNDAVAAHNRMHLLEREILAVNLMGSPGSGKTAVLEATARAFRSFATPQASEAGFPTRRPSLAAIAGDLATDNDSARLRKAGIRSRAIETGQGCHLDAEMVHHELHHMELAGCQYLFIENVGNLVCPAVYDLGQRLNVVALSVTEGEDKPLKYPTMFARADLVLLTKVDLLPHVDVDLARINDNLSRVMPDPNLILVSARHDVGVLRWIGWLEQRREALVLAGRALV